MMIDGTKLKTTLDHNGECVIVTVRQGRTVVDQFNPGSRAHLDYIIKNDKTIRTTKRYDKWWATVAAK